MQISPNLDFYSRKCADGHLWIAVTSYVHRTRGHCLLRKHPYCQSWSCRVRLGLTQRGSSAPTRHPFRIGWKYTSRMWESSLHSNRSTCTYVVAEYMPSGLQRAIHSLSLKNMLYWKAFSQYYKVSNWVCLLKLWVISQVHSKDKSFES